MSPPLSRVVIGVSALLALWLAGRAVGETASGAAARARDGLRAELAAEVEAAALRTELALTRVFADLERGTGAFLLTVEGLREPARPRSLQPLGERVAGDDQGTFYLLEGSQAEREGESMVAAGFYRSASAPERSRSVRARAELRLGALHDRSDAPERALLHRRRALSLLDAEELRSSEALLLRWKLGPVDEGLMEDTLALVGGPDELLAIDLLNRESPEAADRASRRRANLAIADRVLKTIDVSSPRGVRSLDDDLLAWTTTAAGVRAERVGWPELGASIRVHPPLEGDSVWLTSSRPLDGDARPLMLHAVREREAVDAMARRAGLRAGAGLAALLSGLALAIGFTARSAHQARVRARENASLLAHLGHELRTPVASIRMFGETLAGGRADGDDAREFAQTIADESSRLSLLLDKALDLGASRASNEPRQEVDMASIAREALGAARPLLDAEGMTVCAKLDEPLPVHGAPVQLRGAVMVVIENAIQHAAEGGVLRVRGSVAAGSAQLSFEDAGPGMPVELGERVFERFVRGPGARGRGVGLGLALARDTMRRHGGDLQASSASPRGTIFDLQLPLREEARA